jgi:hypothetical protein
MIVELIYEHNLHELEILLEYKASRLKIIDVVAACHKLNHAFYDDSTLFSIGHIYVNMSTSINVYTHRFVGST